MPFVESSESPAVLGTLWNLESGVVSNGLIEETARELMRRAAIGIPEDFPEGFRGRFSRAAPNRLMKAAARPYAPWSSRIK